eukprot:PhM_4_TR5631/c0_g1_i1/m.7773
MSLHSIRSRGVTPHALRSKITEYTNSFGANHPQTLTYRSVLGSVLIRTKQDRFMFEGIRECNQLLEIVADLKGKITQSSDPRERAAAGSEEGMLLQLHQHTLEALLSAPVEVLGRYDLERGYRRKQQPQAQPQPPKEKKVKPDAEEEDLDAPLNYEHKYDEDEVDEKPKPTGDASAQHHRESPIAFVYRDHDTRHGKKYSEAEEEEFLERGNAIRSEYKQQFEGVSQALEENLEARLNPKFRKANTEALHRVETIQSVFEKDRPELNRPWADDIVARVKNAWKQS